MKYFFIPLLFLFHNGQAQKLKKADKQIIKNLQTHIAFLADDKLEGRRAGSEGEKKAADYIIESFKKNGLTAKGDNGTYLQAFEINDGKAIHPATYFFINDNKLEPGKAFFPLSYCPNKTVAATSALSLHQSGEPWFFNLKELLETNKDNPHFDLDDAIKTKTNDAAQKGATALLLYNTSMIDDGLKFDAKAKTATASIVVVYLTKETAEKYLKDETATLDIKLNIQVEEKKRRGHNVVGYIDNGAASTVVLGAHFDHLGYGEDHNSLHTGEAAIHNGADDNASGTSALLELGKMLKASKLTNQNYLLIAFSGEELGLFGSKYFVEHPTINLASVNYMINMDMVGRLNDSTRGLTIGGYGTSPTWGQTIAANDKYFTIKFDSSGAGPSDHTSFYRKDIPVLFFFTGLHTDYHKPSDDAEKINHTGVLMVVKYIYQLMEANSANGKLAFTKTREMQMGTGTKFKVSLGIMPDYTYSGTGVRADGVSEGKIAQKAGIKAGDVLYQIGEYSFTDVSSYMQALSKYKKGDAATVKLRRGTEELQFHIVF